MNKYRKLLLFGSVCIALIFISKSAYIPLKAKLAQYLIQNSWEQLLLDKNLFRAKPWSWADTYPIAKLTYKNTTMYILKSTSGEALSFGAGHYTGTALPASDGDSVIAGHRDTSFAFLKNVKINDMINIQNYLSQTAIYKITNIQIINSNTHKIQIDNSKNRIQLITCYPFDAINSNSPMRYVLYASKIE